MSKLRPILTNSGPVFIHGLITGVLIYLTFAAGLPNG
jgi:hypothetical protein